MNSTREQRKYRFQREMAPHVEPDWAAHFTMELSLQGASGEAIGAALAEVDSHCADSGETAAEAFGPPADYARALDLPPQAQDQGDPLMAAVPPLAQMMGMLPILWALPGIYQGEQVTIHTGELGLLAFTAILTVVMSWQVRHVVRLVVKRPVVALLGSGLVIGLMALVAGLLRHPVAEVQPVLLLAAGLVVLLLATLWGVLRIRGKNTTDDMVATPWEDQAAVQRRARSAQRVGYVPILLMPVFTAALALVLWIFT